MSAESPPPTPAAPNVAAPTGGFVVLVPVKPPVHGKSRLVGVADEVRQELARAFALDTIAAVCNTSEVAQVLVVTDDAVFASEVSALGAFAMPDGTTSDLNATLRLAAAEAHRRWPDHQPVALCADLPALRPADLSTALSEAVGAVFVADAAGLGTTLYSAPYAQFAPRYGGASRIAHRDNGACEVAASVPSLRHDVDDLLDLRRAAELGLGPHTALAVKRHQLA